MPAAGGGNGQRSRSATAAGPLQDGRWTTDATGHHDADQLRRFAPFAGGSAGPADGLQAGATVNYTTLLVVDPVLGDDATCAPLLLLPATPADATVLPCKTLTQTLRLVNGSNHWLVLRPGVHRASSLTTAHTELVIVTIAPPVPAGSDFVVPMPPSPEPVVWDCEGASHCIELGATANGVYFQNLEFINATGHAIIQPNATTTSLSGSSLVISSCTFTGVGGVVKKSGGALTLSGVTVQRCRKFPTDPSFDAADGLVHVEDGDLQLTGCAFNDNVFESTSVMRLGGAST